MNWQTLGQLAGGVGIFLIGMHLMTEGLTHASGERLRTLLNYATRHRLSAFGVGALLTALVQSSSATTLATIGFVSAGLLSFSASLGVILGANVGTTSTAWIVSMVGFKVKASAFAMPMIAAGALLKLFSRGKYTDLGMAIAGFGLVFVGIDTLQAAMVSAGPALLPTDALPPGVLGVLALAGIGAVMTVVMQSSSAAVATTLAALHTGTINFEQAAAMVIGQNVGTTVTAILAAIGGSLEAKRAALAHVLFNFVTGAIALLLLKPMTQLVSGIGQQRFDGDLAMALALFHSGFNLMGVALFLPFTPQFAALVIRLMPTPQGRRRSALDPAVLQLPSVALEAARMEIIALIKNITANIEVTLLGITQPPEGTARLGEALRLIVQGKLPKRAQPDQEQQVKQQREEAMQDLEHVREFLGKLRSSASAQHKRHVSLLHALEHTQRLLVALQEQDEIDTVHHHEPLRAHAATLSKALSAPDLSIEDQAQLNAHINTLEARSKEMANARSQNRVDAMTMAAHGELTPAQAEQLMSAMRWLDRVAFHTWRAWLHLGAQAPQEQAEPIIPELQLATKDEA